MDKLSLLKPNLRNINYFTPQARAAAYWTVSIMPPQPEWIPDFIDRACLTLRLFDEEAPVGCHYFFEDESHEISLFVSSTEVVGGPNDGKRINARYIVDVVELMTIFEEIESITWQAHIVDENDDLGAHLSVSGFYQGEHIWLRVLSETPEQFLPGRLAIVSEKKFVNIWEE